MNIAVDLLITLFFVSIKGIIFNKRYTNTIRKNNIFLFLLCTTFSDISICLFFIGPVSAYFMGLAQFYRFLLPMIFGFLLEKLFNKKVKRPYNLDRRLIPGCVTFGPEFPQCDVLIATSCCLAIAFDSFNTFIYHPM